MKHILLKLWTCLRRKNQITVRPYGRQWLVSCDSVDEIGGHAHKSSELFLGNYSDALTEANWECCERGVPLVKRDVWGACTVLGCKDFAESEPGKEVVEIRKM